MASNKHFLQDRTALLLVSGTAFLTVASIVLILLNLGGGKSSASYTIAYRPSLGIDRYMSGTLRDIISFIFYAVVVFAVSLVLSYKAYPVKRELSLVVLALTIPLLVFMMVVSNALLVLR